MSEKTLKIGLTGGIASGKTAVSDYFLKLNTPVIDADIIARSVVEPNTSGLLQLIKEFSENILNEDGQLDRSLLRKLVFSSPEKLKRLNSILHPIIRNEIIDQVNQIKDHYCIIVIPLLCETNQYKWLNRVLVVDVPTEVQTKRLLKRDNITFDLAKKMLSKQCSRKQRLKIADDVIRNDLDLIQLYAKVDLLHTVYKQLKF